MQVRGQVRASGIATDTRGHVVVRVLDVSRADASSVVVAEADLGDHPLVPGEPFSLDFTIDVGDLDPRTVHAVTAHLDTTGSGEVTRGDWLTTEHVGLPRASDGDDVVVEVPLRPV